MNVFTNPFKVRFNPIKSLKTLLLQFIQYFYDPKVQYIDDLINQWTKSFIQLIVHILFNGLPVYLFLSGIAFIFPKSSPYIFLGSTYWHIPIILMYLGLIIWYTEKTYTWYRLDYKSKRVGGTTNENIKYSTPSARW